MDSKIASIYQSSDHAGTPEHSSVITGGTGGSGMIYTGNLTPVQSVK